MRRMSPGAAALVVAIGLFFCASVAAAGSPYFDQIKDKGQLVIGLNASYPPFTVWAKDGPVGFDVELARNLASVLGLDPEKGLKFVPVKPDEAAGKLTSGEVDIVIAGLIASPERLKQVAFSMPYVTISRAALLQRAKIPRVIIGEVLRPMPVSSYNDLFELEPLRIGAKENTTTIRTAKENFKRSKVVGYPDTGALSTAFLQGRIDVIVHEDPFIRHFNAVHKAERRRFVALTDPVTREGLCIAYRYGDPDFARFLDGYIRRLIENKTIDKWKTKYFDNAAWMEVEK